MAKTADVVNVAGNAMDVEQSVPLAGYSKVIINVDEETVFEAGNDTGTTLEFTNPWGTQKMADDLLAKIRGVEYQPYRVTGGLIDPAAELGDAVSTNGVYGGLYAQDSFFTHQFYADYSAPQDEQLDHEFTYESPTERRITRNVIDTRAEFRLTNQAIELEVSSRTSADANLQAQLNVHSGEIAARVTQTGGSSSSFGWSLVPTGFTIYSGSKAVFTCNSGGLSINGSGTFSGSLSAASGTFRGNLDAAGGTFKGSLSAAGGTFKGELQAATGTFKGSLSAAKGTFAGELQAATGTFKGTLSAASGSFKGNVTCDSLTFSSGVTISGANITDGTISTGKVSDGAITSWKISDSAITSGKISDSAVTEGKISGGAVTEGKIGGGAVTSGKIGSKAVSKAKTTDGVQTSLNNGDSALDKINKLVAGQLNATEIYAGKLYGAQVTAEGLYVYNRNTKEQFSHREQTFWTGCTASATFDESSKKVTVTLTPTTQKITYLGR